MESCSSRYGEIDDEPPSNMRLTTWDDGRRIQATLGSLACWVAFKRDIGYMTISWMMWRHGSSGVISSIWFMWKFTPHHYLLLVYKRRIPFGLIPNRSCVDFMYAKVILRKSRYIQFRSFVIYWFRGVTMEKNHFYITSTIPNRSISFSFLSLLDSNRT